MIASNHGKRLSIQALRVFDGRLVGGGSGPPLVLLLSLTNEAAPRFAIFKGWAHLLSVRKVLEL